MQEIKKNKNLNGSSVSFEQDDMISFDEENHKYKILNDDSEYTSVSQIVGKFFEPFDAEFWSLKKCKNNKDKAEELRDQWIAKGQRASQTGTFLHKQIEDYLNGVFDGNLTTRISYKGKYHSFDEETDISLEWAMFINFRTQTEFIPFRTEWRVFDPEYKIAGTLDFVCACEDGSYEVYDWKRSNKIDPLETNIFQSGINGLETLTDTSYIHYCLQQNLYKYILEKNYGIRIKRLNLVVLHPDKDDYQIVSIPDMENEVNIMLNMLKFL